MRRTAARAARAAIVALAACGTLIHAAALAGPPAAAGAPDLQPRTLQAWAEYEKAADARHARAGAGEPFFALDAFGAPAWRADARSGGIPMLQIERPRPGAREVAVPDGRIHHWAGAIFVPGMSLPTLLERLSRLAGHEASHYEDVIGSRLLARDGDRYRIFLKLRRSKIVTVTYNTEHEVVYRRLGEGRATARSASTRIAELDNAGTPDEREKPVGRDSGYLWRLNAYWRYEAVDGGVLVECESISLSRSVPLLLRPFISGVAEGVARESLERTLRGLRQALASPDPGRR